MCCKSFWLFTGGEGRDKQCNRRDGKKESSLEESPRDRKINGLDLADTA